jgi:hypothetical protein
MHSNIILSTKTNIYFDCGRNNLGSDKTKELE